MWTDLVIQNLKPGQLIRSKSSEISFIVTDVFGDRATAVRVADITNPCEWEVHQPSILNDPEISLS